MFRKMILSIVAVMFVFTAVGGVLAMDEGNKRKGKYTYRKVYKSCFERGEASSETPPISPNTKTQAEWKQLYTAKDHSQFGCQEEWAKLSDEEVLDIFTYLHAHASDSPTPASCK
ncbi:MAG: cytochrome c family protein [Desulfobacterales bacterium]